MTYRTEYEQSIQDPEAFWRRQAAELAWYKEPTTILSLDANGHHRWFADGVLNTAYLALDYHVENGRAEQAALLYDSPVTGSKRQYTYRQLRDEVARFAGALRTLGVAKGDRVIIYMPMIPEAVVAMLACARLGAIHSVVFGGFAAHELAVRIDDARPKVLVTASCGIEIARVLPYMPIVDKALELSKAPPERVVVVARPQQGYEPKPGRDCDWTAVMAAATPVEPVPVQATDPLYILYTSGTTGKPKGVVRDNGGHAVAMKYSMKVIYNVEPGEVYWAGSDVGWVVGHSYIVYAPLLHGCATVLYEGKPVKTPDAGAFWRVIAEYGVSAFFTSPTAFRAIKKEDPEARLKAQYDISSLKKLFLAGERLDPPTYSWLTEISGLPVLDHWWQTETGWAIVANPVGIEPMPVKSGSATFPVPGYNVCVLDTAGARVAAGASGKICIKLPLPPGCLQTLWQDDARFHESYLAQYPGYYLTADGGYMDDDGYVFIMGRIDDVINVAGHRLSTGQIEELLGSHAAVAECAVVGVNDELKGEVPLGLVVLKDGVSVRPEHIEKELIVLIRDQLGAIAAPRNVAVVPRLPKTRSGKILRNTIRQLSVRDDVPMPATIDDPAALNEMRETLRALGLGRSD
ncbi:MAG: propionyl-CoA synthetase [Rhizomicrobium sp.]